MTDQQLDEWEHHAGCTLGMDEYDRRIVALCQEVRRLRKALVEIGSVIREDFGGEDGTEDDLESACKQLESCLNIVESVLK